MGAPFDGTRFRNENAAADRSLRQVLRWATSRQRKPWPRWVGNAATYAPHTPAPGQLAITFVNHATFLIQGRAEARRYESRAEARRYESRAEARRYDGEGDGGRRDDDGIISVLTDPVWSRRASPFQWMGPARVRNPGVPFDQLPRIDLILVSHNHYDHMDLRTLRALQRRFTCPIVTTLGNKAFLERRGLRDMHELDWWQSFSGRRERRPLRPPSPPEAVGASPEAVGADVYVGPITITATPAQHFAARTPFDRNRTLWAGFVLDLGGRRLFFTGDSGYAPHFADVGARLGPLDVSLIPIGAYEPRWFMSAAHMNPDEAVRAHLDLRSPLSVAMHFGCFQLTDEAIDEPERDLQRALAEHGVEPSRFRVLQPGETLIIGDERVVIGD